MILKAQLRRGNLGSAQLIGHLTPPKDPHNCKVCEVMVKATRDV